MKKYVKPELFFESYELSQSIAACGWDLNYADPNSCTATGDSNHGIPGILIFTELAKCDNVPEGYCYENSSDTTGTVTIFRS